MAQRSGPLQAAVALLAAAPPDSKPRWYANHASRLHDVQHAAMRVALQILDVYVCVGNIAGPANSWTGC